MTVRYFRIPYTSNIYVCLISILSHYEHWFEYYTLFVTPSEISYDIDVSWVVAYCTLGATYFKFSICEMIFAMNEFVCQNKSWRCLKECCFFLPNIDKRILVLENIRTESSNLFRVEVRVLAYKPCSQSRSWL